jgi:hypothetical protein
MKILLRILILTASLAVQTQAQTFLTNGLVAYYRFNGNANDASGNGKNAVPQGSPLYSIDRLGVTNSAVLLVSATQYLTVPPGLLNVATNQGFSVSVWVKPANLDSAMSVLEWGDASSLGTHLFLNEQGAGRILWTAGYTGTFPNGEIDVLPSARAVDTNSFSQVVATCDTAGGATALYLNGVLIGSTSYSPPLVSGTAYGLFIGHRPLAGDNNPFTGELDDVRIYSRALSISEVQQLYAVESGPRVDLIKAVKPSFANLSLGTNYQLQMSSDLSTWTNTGSVFTATNTSMIYPQYWDVYNWGKLFFRLQISP